VLARSPVPAPWAAAASNGAGTAERASTTAAANGAGTAERASTTAAAHGTIAVVAFANPPTIVVVESHRFTREWRLPICR